MNKRIVFFAIVSSLLVYYLYQEYHRWKVLAESSAIESFRQRVLMSYLSNKESDKWWLENITDKDSTELLVVTENIEKAIAQAIEHFENLSPLTQEIADNFKHPRVSIFDKGQSIMFFPDRGEKLPPDTVLGDKSIEICFVPKSQSKGHLSSIYYLERWNALMIFALEFPSPVFIGFLWHELGHALFYKEGAPSSKALRGSDLWISEEVIFHQLEGEIFNKVSKGKFFDYLDKLIAENRARSYREIILSLTLGNLNDLHRILECDQCGRTVSRLILMQELFSLGVRFIDIVRQDKKEADQEKIQLYQWITTDLLRGI